MSATIRSVLVVEDEQDDTEYILQTLSKFDIVPKVHPRSYEAICHLQQNEAPALILLDWKIPGGGASVLRAQYPPSR